MTDKPQITVGITAFNASATIERAIGSALSQDWPVFEIVIVDDFSTDGTFTILQKVKENHPDLRIFRNDKNLGVAASRNRIVREARGDFIAFFDDDDESAPDRLRRQYERIISCAGPAPVICHTARRQVWPDGTIRIEPTVIDAPGSAVAARILFNRRLRGGGSLATCSQMARRDVYLFLGGFDESFRRAEDTDFCLRLALAGGSFVGLDVPLVTQAMTRGSDKNIEDERFYALKLYEKHRAVMGRRYGFDYGWIAAKYEALAGRWVAFVLAMAGLFFRHPILFSGRVLLALPNIGYNLAFGKFHRQKA